MNRSDHPLCTFDGKSVTLSLHIQPRASKNEVCGVQDNALKIRLTSPPVDGAANKLCREFIADLFDVSKSSVEIISGETSRYKRVRVSGRDQEQLRGVIDRIVML